jgi:hypothetical protein
VQVFFADACLEGGVKDGEVAQPSTGWSKRLPAQKTGGLYKTCHQQRMVIL